VRECRGVDAECAEQEDVLRRVRQMIVATRDVRDLHVDIVDDDREVIRRMVVRAQQHEVVDQIGVEVDVAANEVVKIDRPVADFEADDVLHVERRRA